MKKKFNLVSVSIVIVMCLLFVTACNFNSNSSLDPTASGSSQNGTANTTASDSAQRATASGSSQNGTANTTASASSQRATASGSSQNGTANTTASASSQGNTINWTFDAESGKLSIFGKGEMTDYSETNSPWQEYKASIKSVEISDGVTNIGANRMRSADALY